MASPYPNNRGFRGPAKPLHRLNGEIDAATVRLVGEADESKNGLINTDEALRMARERQEDLVEISGAANPPVCRIIEYSKFKYELKKKEKDAKSKQHIVVVKEIRFGPNTDDHDFNFKLKHAETFLNEGNKIKAYVVFHGRSIVHSERGLKLLRAFAEKLQHVGKIEAAPKLEGKRMFMLLAPLLKK